MTLHEVDTIYLQVLHPVPATDLAGVASIRALVLLWRECVYCILREHTALRSCSERHLVCQLCGAHVGKQTV